MVFTHDDLGPVEGDYRLPILVTTVELGGDRSATITLYEEDDPKETARRFCQEHGLPDAIIEPLTLHVLENLETWEAQNSIQQEKYANLAGEDESAKKSRITQETKPRDPSLVQKAAETVGNTYSQRDLATVSASSKAPPTRGALSPFVRPSSANCSLGTEYYGRPLPIVSSRTADAAAAPAADRLYADHFRKLRMLEEQRRIRDLELQLATQQVHCTPVSRALAAHRSAQGYGSYGERLYVEGRLDAMRREQDAERARAEEAEAELAGATFHPRISKMARELKLLAAAGKVSSYASTGYSAAPWDRLYRQNGTARKERRAEAIRREQEEAELKECSFRPQLDKRSSALVRARRDDASAAGFASYDRLYKEGLRKKGLAEAAAAAWLPDDATFRPVINSKSTQVNTSSVGVGDLMARRHQQDPAAMARDVAERLLARGQRYRERLEAVRAASAVPIDSDGKPLFQPRINSYRPRGGSRPTSAASTASVGDHLYAAALESAAKAERAAEATRRKAVEEAASTHVNALSERMMERLKRDRLLAVFAYLSCAPTESDCSNSTRNSSKNCIDLLEVVADEAFMDTIDPEVRADVEHAARLLQARTLSAKPQLDSVTDEDDKKKDEQGIATNTVKASMFSELLDCRETDGRSGSAPSFIDEASFVALMQEVLRRTRGIVRQYLLPLPSGRKKWEDPTFCPAVDQRSKALAARTRPDGVPAHEILYCTAKATAAKLEAARQARDDAVLSKCSFKPELVAARLVEEGRALKLAAQPTPHAKKVISRQGGVAVAAEEENANALLLKGTDALDPTADGVTPHDNKVGVGGSKNGLEERYHQHLRYGDSCRPEQQPAEDRPLGLPRAALRPANSHGRLNAKEPPINASGGDKLRFPKYALDIDALEDGIDAIERQIKEATARLSASGETLVANLCISRDLPATVGGVELGEIAELTSSSRKSVPEADARMEGLGGSLDYGALFDPGTLTPGNGGPSSMMEFNPVEEYATPGVESQGVRDSSRPKLMALAAAPLAL